MENSVGWLQGEVNTHGWRQPAEWVEFVLNIKIYAGPWLSHIGETGVDDQHAQSHIRSAYDQIPHIATGRETLPCEMHSVMCEWELRKQKLVLIIYCTLDQRNFVSEVMLCLLSLAVICICFIGSSSCTATQKCKEPVL